MPLLQEPTSPASATAFTSNGTSPAPHGTSSQRSTRSLPAFRYRNNNNNNNMKAKYHRFHENAYADYANDDTEDYIEVQGMGLLQDREAAQELHKQRHLMTFNSVQLLKKQKVWLEDVSGTNGTIIELENLERKINWFMENKQQKKDNDPLTPSKALFRSMSMLDTTMEKIQQSHFKEMQKSRSEMQELKKIIASLQSRNSALLDATAGLQKERDALKQELQDEKAAAAASAAAAEAATKEQSVVATAVAVVSEDEEENIAAAEISVDSGDDAIEPSSSSSTPTKQSKGLDPAAVLGDDLGSRWHTLEDSEEATAHVASLEKQVCQLSALVAEKNGAIENLKGEWQHMRLQLSKLEESRLEYKKECETKESALAVASSRIASLESEVLQTHAKCATSEEDYDALKESFITQKEATKQEIMKSQEECGRKIDEIRTECERLLEASNETVNGLKVTIGGLQNELKELRETCTEQDEKIKRIGGLLKRNMKSEGDGVVFSRSVVDEVFQEVDGFGFSAAGGLSCDKEGEEKDEENAKSIGNAHGHFNVGRKLAERASSQASTIADLQDANEIKDAQLKALHDMVESLLAERGEMADSRQWGHRIQKWKDSRK